MKKLILVPVLLTMAFACKKPVSDLETTPTLDVEEKNMGVWGVRTATWCGPCGSSLNGTQDIFEQNKHLVVGMAFKDAFIGAEGAQSDWGNHMFDVVAGQFDLGSSVPTTFQNFNTGTPGTIAEHLAAEVVVNGNYEIDFNGNDMVIRTTTKFFTNYEEQVFLVPFIIVDDLVGYQTSHPESPNTVHKRYVADVALPVNKASEDKNEWGYLISDRFVKEGHTVNMTFKATKKSQWANQNVKIGMVYFRKIGNQFFFLNAFSKY